MNESMTALARRAVASPQWRWMPGMLVVSTNNYHRPARIESLDGDTYGLTVVPHADGPVFASHHEYGIAGDFPRGCSVPDLADPATLGCLLALVEEAHGVSDTAIRPICKGSDIDRWVLNSYEKERLENWNSVLGVGPSRAVALVAALEAASTEVG